MCQPTQTLHTTQNRPAKNRGMKREARDGYLRTDKEGDTQRRRKLHITFQHKESDFDKWLF